MANPRGRTGRDGEHTVAGWLEEAGFTGVEREGRRAASLDIVAPGLTVPVEVKRRATLDVPGWTRTVASRHGDIWSLFIVQRDARKKVHPDLMVVPARFGAKLLALYDRVVCQTCRGKGVLGGCGQEDCNHAHTYMFCPECNRQEIT